MPLRLSTSYFFLNKPLERKQLNWKPSSGLVLVETTIIGVQSKTSPLEGFQELVLDATAPFTSNFSLKQILEALTK